MIEGRRESVDFSDYSENVGQVQEDSEDSSVFKNDGKGIDIRQAWSRTERKLNHQITCECMFHVKHIDRQDHP